MILKNISGEFKRDKSEWKCKVVCKDASFKAKNTTTNSISRFRG